VTGRDRLLAILAPDLVEAIDQLVEERVRATLEAQASNGGSPWLSLDEAAEYLRVSPRTLERQLARGRVRSSGIGRRRLLHRDDLTREDVAPTTPPRRRTRTLDRDRTEA
jgi:excisionase family DNA binding protein